MKISCVSYLFYIFVFFPSGPTQEAVGRNLLLTGKKYDGLSYYGGSWMIPVNRVPASNSTPSLKPLLVGTNQRKRLLFFLRELYRLRAVYGSRLPVYGNGPSKYMVVICVCFNCQLWTGNRKPFLLDDSLKKNYNRWSGLICKVTALEQAIMHGPCPEAALTLGCGSEPRLSRRMFFPSIIQDLRLTASKVGP